MMYEMHIQNEQGFEVAEGNLREAAATVLAQHDMQADSSITIVITGDLTIRSLNRLHRGLDAPTDVLSFPMDPLPPELAAEGTYLGDIVIAYHYASAQAAQLGHSLENNLALLVVHGTLHLLGYDHATLAEKVEMWAAQASALQVLGISEALVPALESEGHV